MPAVHAWAVNTTIVVERERNDSDHEARACVLHFGSHVCLPAGSSVADCVVRPAADGASGEGRSWRHLEQLQ